MATVIRNEFSKLSDLEKKRFTDALIKLKTHDISTNTPSTTGGTYQKYVRWHNDAAEHRTTSVAAWHRVFLWELEEDIIAADKLLGSDGNIAIPYWKWQKHGGLPGTATGTLWSDKFLGGDGMPVKDGPFVAPPWTIFNGATARATGLGRELSVASSSFPSAANVWDCILLKKFDEAPFNDSSPNTSFRNVLEGWEVTTPGSTNLHNNAHVWVGGDMMPFTSPNDPVFFLNHSNVDRVWAAWQWMNPNLVDQHPSDADIDAVGQSVGGQPPKPLMPRKLNDIMTPWDGTAGTRIWTVKDSLNFQKMGDKFSLHNYNYDSYVSLGSLTL